MVKTNIYTDTDERKIIDELGAFSVLEYDRDYSVDIDKAMKLYYASQMNVHRKQLLARLSNSGIIAQAGSMQIMMGSISAETNVSGAGDFLKKVVGSKVTGETAIKPRYFGDGVVVFEPTLKFILLENVENWPGGMVIEDGAFLACEETVTNKVTARSTLSSAVLGGEGLFNTILKGNGVAALESNVPREEIVAVELVDDVLKIDGNMAIAWSGSLKFSVEKTTKTLVGSAVSKEGFVNVYRGTGRVLIATVNN